MIFLFVSDYLEGFLDYNINFAYWQYINRRESSNYSESRDKNENILTGEKYILVQLARE